MSSRGGGARYVALAACSVWLVGLICSDDDTASPDENGGNQTLQGELVMELTWGTAGNMDIGATTPNGGVIAANFPGNDANCTHSGDDQGIGAGPFVETMTCADPAEPGGYKIVVENFSSGSISYTLTVKLDGQDVSNFPILKSLAGNGGTDNHTFTL
jgi:hypothetical protein